MLLKTQAAGWAKGSTPCVNCCGQEGYDLSAKKIDLKDKIFYNPHLMEWPPHIPLPEAQRVRNYAALLLLAGSLATGIVRDAPLPLGATPQQRVVYNVDGCVSPQTGDFAAIQNLAAQPENPLMTLDAIGGGKNGINPHIPAEAYREKIAHQYGLHIYDATPILDQLATEDSHGALSYTKYLSAAQQFMAHFGVDVRLATAEDSLAYGGKPLTDAQLNSSNMKWTLINLMTAYSDVPVEYVALGGEKEIIFAGNLAQNGAAAYAVTGTVHDTTVYDATLAIDTQTYGHELGHLIDNSLCGASGMSKDTEFAAINGGNSELYNGKEYNPAMPNYVDFSTQEVDVFIEAMHLAQQGEVARACSIINAQYAKAAQITSWSEYHPNTAEGKAELYGELFNPETYVTMLDPRNVVLRKQFIFLLARLHAVNPALSNYFLDTARRPLQSSATSCNAKNLMGQSPGAGTASSSSSTGYKK